MSEQILFTQEVKRIYENAAEISAAAGKPLDTSTLLLAMFAVPCTAQAILAENRIDDIRLMNLLSKIPADGDSVLGPVCSNALRIAANIGSPAATSVHLLLAILSAPSCRGARVILATGIPLLTLRSRSLAHLMDPAMKQAATSKVHIDQVTGRFVRAIFMGCHAPICRGATAGCAESAVQAIGKGRTASNPLPRVRMTTNRSSSIATVISASLKCFRTTAATKSWKMSARPLTLTLTMTMTIPRPNRPVMVPSDWIGKVPGSGRMGETQPRRLRQAINLLARSRVNR